MGVHEQAHLGGSSTKLFFEFRSAECGVSHAFLLEDELRSVP
jgi:hypothetical protein